MNRSPLVSALVFLLSFGPITIAATAVDARVTIDKDSRSTSAIVVGEAASAPERHAARELQRYVMEITGLEVPVVADSETVFRKYKQRIVIGTPETNRAIERLRGVESLEQSLEGITHDGFLLQTVRNKGAQYFVIASSLPRGCLYGVYHLIEKYFRVGFFWDGDYIPRSSQLVLGGVDCVENPHFRDREYMQMCAYGYSAMFWGIEEWKNELDWAAKKKFNVIQITFGQAVSRYNAMNALGVKSAPPTAWEKHESMLARQVRTHARQLGLRIVHPAFDGMVPPEFREKYPSMKSLEVTWLDLPPRIHILPSDPMFVKVGARFIEEHNKICGTDHLYNVDPFPETDPGDSPEEKLKVKVDFARAVVESVKKADPKATWVMSGWAFTYDHIWTEADVEAFLRVIPEDMFIVNDIWAEHNPVYKTHDYFHGKRWGFSALHSMGGWTTVHGDLADLVRRVQEVVDDPKAAKCTNFYLNPEIVNHNDVYFDLSGELAWNPRPVEVDSFLDDYLSRRYGAEAAPGMRKSWDELLQSVYGHYDFTAPVYHDRLTLDVKEIYGKLRHGFIPHLRRALELALSQEKTLHGNNFYQRDIVDVTRQYVAEVFNFHFERLVESFKSRDTESFEREARTLKLCLSSQEKILSSHPAFFVATEVQNSRRLPKYSSPFFGDALDNLEDNGAVIRQRYTALAGIEYYPTLIDYARKDLYELVKYYYHGRLDLYLAYLRDKLAKSEDFSSEEIEERYRDWTKKFVTIPYESVDPSRMPYYGKPGLAAREILAALDREEVGP